jgi:hypothetical protein
MTDYLAKLKARLAQTHHQAFEGFEGGQERGVLEDEMAFAGFEGSPRRDVFNIEGPTEWAEAAEGLNPSRPPQGVPQHRWAQFIEVTTTFLAGTWADKAKALGWTTLDLFGCDAQAPWARIDRLGLIWLLSGRKLIALASDTATLQARSGSRLTFSRNPIDLEGGLIVPGLELQ